MKRGKNRAVLRTQPSQILNNVYFNFIITHHRFFDITKQYCHYVFFSHSFYSLLLLLPTTVTANWIEFKLEGLHEKRDEAKNKIEFRFAKISVRTPSSTVHFFSSFFWFFFCLLWLKQSYLLMVNQAPFTVPPTFGFVSISDAIWFKNSTSFEYFMQDSLFVSPLSVHMIRFEQNRS